MEFFTKMLYFNPEAIYIYIEIKKRCIFISNIKTFCNIRC